jgi:hypothetical protein
LQTDNFKSSELDLKQRSDANFATGSLAADASYHKNVA